MGIEIRMYERDYTHVEDIYNIMDLAILFPNTHVPSHTFEVNR